jgi:hypothetical protein
MICSDTNCGFQNRDGAAFCANCGRRLGNALVAAPPAALELPPTMANRKPGVYAIGKNHFVATMIAIFLPSFGQLYNGDTKKWFAFFAAFIVCSVGSGTIILGLVGFALWLFSIIDAYQVAKREKALW